MKYDTIRFCRVTPLLLSNCSKPAILVAHAASVSPLRQEKARALQKMKGLLRGRVNAQFISGAELKRLYVRLDHPAMQTTSALRPRSSSQVSFRASTNSGNVTWFRGRVRLRHTYEKHHSNNCRKRRLSRENTSHMNNNNGKINAAPRQSLMKSLNKCSSGFLFLLPVWRSITLRSWQLVRRLRRSLHNGSCTATRLKQHCQMMRTAEQRCSLVHRLAHSVVLTVAALNDWVPPRCTHPHVSWTSPGSPSWQWRPRSLCAWPCPRLGWCACTGRCTRQTREHVGRSCSLSR